MLAFIEDPDRDRSRMGVARYIIKGYSATGSCFVRRKAAIPLPILIH